jgi:hypothetical protein
MKIVKWVSIFAGVLMTAASHGVAADMDEAAPISGGLFGNFHVGASTYFDSIDGDDVWVPAVNIGGKVGYESEVSPWGWQADIDYSHSEFDWVKPSVGIDGHINSVDTAGHLTYRTSDASKIGIYAGYATIGLQEDGVGNALIGSMGIGVEGLTTIIYVRASGVGSATDVLGDVVGGTIGGSVHHAFTQNISAKLAANYTYIGSSDDVDSHVVSVGAVGRYTFSSMPLSLSTSVGYSNIDVEGLSIGGFTAGNSITYSFGGPSSGSTGKLFNSGVLGFGLQ